MLKIIGIGVVVLVAGFLIFAATRSDAFRIERTGDTTTVTWAMFGPSPYLSKVMGLVFSMEKMVGGQFETGLANLKSITEK